MTSTTIPQSQATSAKIVRFPASRIVRSLKDRAILRAYYRKLAAEFDGALAWKIARNAHALDRHIQSAPDLPKPPAMRSNAASKEEALLQKLERRIDAKREQASQKRFDELVMRLVTRAEELRLRDEQESDRA